MNCAGLIPPKSVLTVVMMQVAAIALDRRGESRLGKPHRRDYGRHVPTNHEVMEEHLQKGRLDPAEAMSRILLDQNPGDSEAHVAFARICAARGQLDDAITRLEHLLAQDAQQPNPLAYLAVFWGLKGDDKRALTLARRAASMGAEVAASDVMIGNDALARADLDEALLYFQRATQVRHPNAEAFVGKGRVHVKRGELAEAEDAFARAVELDPKMLAAWLALIDVEIQGGAEDAADDNIAMALKSHAGHPELLQRKAARDEAKHKNDPVEAALRPVREAIYHGDAGAAVEALDLVIEEYPDDPRYLVLEAELAATTGHGDIAYLLNELNRSVRERGNDWQLRAALGRLQLRPGPLQNIRAAMSNCEEAWRTSGEHPRAGLFLFESYAIMGKRAFAIALGKRVIELAPLSLEAPVLRGMLKEFGIDV
jgi:tetratricopeptide (TPR) repeat protein